MSDWFCIKNLCEDNGVPNHCGCYKCKKEREEEKTKKEEDDDNLRNRPGT